VARTDYKVRELVDKIQRKELMLPEMQRKYVWTSTKVRDLLDSLYRGYPSGVILAWQSAIPVETRDFEVDTPHTPGSPPLLLLDGQQRLTSLSAVLRGAPVGVKNRKRPVEILFNLDHPEELTFITEVVDEAADNDDDADDDDNDDEADEDPLARVNRRAFVVASNPVLAMLNWVKVSDVFTKSDKELLQSAGVTSLDDPRYERYSDRLKRLRAIADYTYRVDILEPDKTYEEVTEIFVRVNSLGAKLRSSDLALAQITAKWNGSLKIFQEYQRGIEKQGFALDLGIHLKTLVALVTNQSRFLTVGSLTRPQLEAGWKRTKRAMDYAVNFAKANVGIDSPTLLSSPFLLITTAYWSDQRGYQIDPIEAAAFRQWFLIANAKGRYSRGSSETLLDQDLSTLREGNGGGEELRQRLVQQVGRLDFSADDLVGRTSRSGAFKTLFAALRADNAKDWKSQLQISPKHQGMSDRVEYHHVVPKAFMKKTRPDLEPRDIDDLANLAFIGADTNKEIRDKAPADYAAKYPAELLAIQLIDLTGGLDSPETFEEFVARRRVAIAQRLNEYLGVQTNV
jgi:hypothetical protein